MQHGMIAPCLVWSGLVWSGLVLSGVADEYRRDRTSKQHAVALPDIECQVAHELVAGRRLNSHVLERDILALDDVFTPRLLLGLCLKRHKKRSQLIACFCPEPVLSNAPVVMQGNEEQLMINCS